MDQKTKKLWEDLGEILSVMKRMNYSGINDKKNVVYEVFENNYNIFPLPSGNYGNALALALEMNYYVVARHILNNYKNYHINLNKCMFTEDKKYYNAKEVFEFSLKYNTDEEDYKEVDYTGKNTFLKELSFLKKDPVNYYKRESIARNIHAKVELENTLYTKKK